MATNDLPLNELFGIPEGPIPPVDPADLRSVWQMQRELQARVPGQQIGIIADYNRACSPGANIDAVWFRVSMIRMLEMLGLLGRWIQDGVLADAVFKVAATFPMEGMTIGVPRQGLPFDVQEFMSQVAKP